MKISRQSTEDAPLGMSASEERLLPEVGCRSSYSQISSSDGQDDDFSSNQRNPEEHASWWAKWTYSYASSLIKLGYKQPLHQEDLWEMAPNNEALLLTDKFHASLHSTSCAKAPHVSQTLLIVLHCLLHFTLL